MSSWIPSGFANSTLPFWTEPPHRGVALSGTAISGESANRLRMERADRRMRPRPNRRAHSRSTWSGGTSRIPPDAPNGSRLRGVRPVSLRAPLTIDQASRLQLRPDLGHLCWVRTAEPGLAQIRPNDELNVDGRLNARSVRSFDAVWFRGTGASGPPRDTRRCGAGGARHTFRYGSRMSCELLRLNEGEPCICLQRGLAAAGHAFSH